MPSAFFISYRLRAEKDYESLHAAIKDAGSADWIHPFDNAWVIESDEEAKTLVESFTPVVDSDDSLLVVRVGAADLNADYGGQNLGNAEPILQAGYDYDRSGSLDLSIEINKRSFVVSCDLGENDTSAMFDMLRQGGARCEYATTSTWIVRTTVQLHEIHARINAELERQDRSKLMKTSKALVAQITNCPEDSRLANAFLLGAVSSDDKERLRNIQTISRVLKRS